MNRAIPSFLASAFFFITSTFLLIPERAWAQCFDPDWYLDRTGIISAKGNDIPGIPGGEMKGTFVMVAPNRFMTSGHFWQNLNRSVGWGAVTLMPARAYGNASRLPFMRFARPVALKGQPFFAKQSHALLYGLDEDLVTFELSEPIPDMETMFVSSYSLRVGDKVLTVGFANYGTTAELQPMWAEGRVYGSCDPQRGCDGNAYVNFPLLSDGGPVPRRGSSGALVASCVDGGMIGAIFAARFLVPDGYPSNGVVPLVPIISNFGASNHPN